MPKLTPIRRRRIRRILNWLRTDFDIDLPDLPKGSATECPVKRALSTKYPDSFVGNVSYIVLRPGEDWGQKRYETLPPFVQTFTEEFDSGHWPEYVA